MRTGTGTSAGREREEGEHGHAHTLRAHARKKRYGGGAQTRIHTPHKAVTDRVKQVQWEGGDGGPLTMTDNALAACMNAGKVRADTGPAFALGPPLPLPFTAC